MEPQLEGCGKPAARPRVDVRRRASMEPQLEGCGKKIVLERMRWLPRLQWSRNLRVAESVSLSSWPQ